MRIQLGSLRLRPRRSGEDGFTLIEVLFALILFAGLAAAMAGVLTSAISTSKLSRQRTIADQIALEQIEQIRRMPYDQVGLPLGNPPGTVVSPVAINPTGLKATAAIQIAYVDDPTPTSYETTANYKRVIVTITRDSDGKVLAREITYIAPTSRTPFGGVNLGIIKANVIDYFTNQPVEGALVNLLVGPSAPRSDTTDSAGQVTFSKLTPNPTASCPSDCYDLTASLSGYVMLDSPQRVNIGPGQTVTPTLTIYRPSTINIALLDTGGAPYTGPAFVKLTSAYDGSTQTYAVSGGSAAITLLSGKNILPNVEYTAEAWTTGTPLCSTTLTKRVPDDYPSVLSTTFPMTMGACPSGSVAVTVRWGTGGPAPAATVTLSGGPYALTPVTGTTNSSGQVTFSNVPSGAGYTVEATKAGLSATPQTISVATGATTNVIMQLPAGSVIAQVRWAGSTVNGATVRVTGGPDAVDLTLTTGVSGNVTFANLPPGPGYTVVATKSGQSVSATFTNTMPTTVVTLNLPTGTLVVNVKRLGVNVPGGSVRLQLGPMNVNVLRATNTSGNATFTNVPVGTGYSIKAWKTNCTGSPNRSGVLTNQTKGTGSTTINITFPNDSPCPVP